MKIENTQVTKLVLSGLDRIDPISVFAEDYGKGRGRITITCYGKAWTSFWGAMGDRTISQFFCSCDEHYLAGNLSNIDSTVYDIDELEKQAEEKGIKFHRDDPWHDYEFMDAMYGGDMGEWHSALPEKPNPDYEYLCRIIKAVQAGFLEQADRKAA